MPKVLGNAGRVVHQQVVVPEMRLKDIIWTLDEDLMQGYPGSKKNLYTLTQRYYYPNLAAKVQEFKKKSISKQCLGPPLQMVYDPTSGPEDLLEIDEVRQLPPINGLTHILTAVDVFSKFIFAIPLRWPDAPSVERGLSSIFNIHAYVRKTILTDKGLVFTAEVLKQTVTNY